MDLNFEYGTSRVTASMNWGRCLGTIDVRSAPGLADIAQTLQQGLERPIGMAASFLDGFRAGQKVVIIVSDAYRRTGIERVLPSLIEHIVAAGVRQPDIEFLVAGGIHKPPTPAQLHAILGPTVYERFCGRVTIHDPHDPGTVRALGVTSRGTPVAVNRRALECDRLIATGTVVLHYFGGFGGGRKSIVPGIASAQTIAHNHALNLHPRGDRLNPDVRIGVLDGNPVAEDMLEAARRVPVHGIINTVMNADGDIAGLFVGEMDAAHRAAAKMAAALYTVPIDEPADFVIAGAGSARNYVQSHKALYNAFQAVRPGGRIVFVARCEEGLGGEPIEKWLRLGNREAIFKALRANSEIYGQTALSTLEKAAHAILVTDLSDDDVRLLGARKALSLQAALETLRDELGDSARYYVMPAAAFTVPARGRV